MDCMLALLASNKLSSSGSAWNSWVSDSLSSFASRMSRFKAAEAAIVEIVARFDPMAGADCATQAVGAAHDVEPASLVRRCAGWKRRTAVATLDETISSG
eukprot:5210398-Pleurochrysis_carterae.AAC.1